MLLEINSLYWFGKMRILMLLSKYGRKETTLYGPLVDFCEELADLGHKIYVLTKLRNNSHVNTKKNESIDLNYVKLPKNKLYRLFQFLLFLIKSIEIIKKENIDVIYSHIYGFYGLINVLGGLLTNRLRIHWHCGFVGHFRRKMTKKEVFLGYVPLQLTMKFVDCLITGVEATKRHYSEFFGILNKIQLMPNGVSVKRFNPNISTEELVYKFKLIGKKKILYVHRLASRKGPEYLIKAMELIKTQIRNCILILVGDGPQREQLEQLTKKRGLEKDIIFTGKIPNADIPKFLALADVFVVPSTEEGFSRALAEAMACKKPIVATNVGGNPEVAPDGKVAILVPPRDPDTLAKAIIRILIDKDLAEYLSRNGYKRAINKYSQEKVAKRFIEIISQLTQKKN